MVLVAQMIEAVCAFNHSIPRMRSILDIFKTMGGTWNSRPSISTGTLRLTMVVRHWPAGVCTTSGLFISSNLRPCMDAKSSDMKECDAPESNKTEVGAELTRRVPNTVAGRS